MLKMVKIGPDGRKEISDPNEFIKTLFGDLEKMKKNASRDEDEDEENDFNNDSIKWGVIANVDNKDSARQLVIVAPFARSSTITAEVGKETINSYILTVSWENTNIIFNGGGNINVKPKDSLTIRGIPKLDKKNCKIFFKDGCIYVTLWPLAEKITDCFKLTIDK